MSGEPRTNFGFLDRCDPRVAHLARQAEHYGHTDPDSCLFKLRLKDRVDGEDACLAVPSQPRGPT